MFGNYKSNDEEIIHNGTLLKKAGLENEQIKYSLKFDLVIETNKRLKYKASIELNLPEGDILQEGTTALEKVNFEDIVFKRI